MMSKTLIPNRGQVILSRKVENQTSSGLIITGSPVQEDKGTIISLGALPVDNGVEVTYSELKTGLVARYSKHSGNIIKLGDGEELIIVPYSSILAVEIEE